MDPSVAAEGLASVLGHAIGLLCSFIGEDLVIPIVQDAWGAPPEGNLEKAEDNS